ncbi:MAG: hypothetical protein ACTSXP_06875 [Promethearchaeota archaeon]
MASSTDQHELIKRFKNIIKFSKRIKLSTVLGALGLDETEFISFIAGLGEDLPIKIDVEYLIVDDFKDFVDYTAQLFESWANMESAKIGKLDALPEGNTPANSHLTGTNQVDPVSDISTSVQMMPAKYSVPEWKKKYNFKLQLGNATKQEGNLEEALENYKFALSNRRRKLRATLTLQTRKLINELQITLKTKSQEKEQLKKIKERIEEARSLLDDGA